MPRTALTFGIEIECLVGTLLPHQTHRNVTETRFAHFPKLSSSQGTEITWEDVADHIRKTLSNAGFNVKPTPSYPLQETHLQNEEPNPFFDEWEVDTDNSIRGPQEKNGYSTVGIEIRSAAMYFNDAALQEVGRSVSLLKNTYLLSLNKTTGLHVHVGNGLHGFYFHTLQRLMAFLFAFEPQLNSLHPQGRFNTSYASSLRYGSRYSQDFLEARERRPRPLEGVAHFLLSPSWKDLLRDCEPSDDKPRLAYRFADLAKAELMGSPQGCKMTVEFRQHAGSVDCEEILNWIRTTVGMVWFVMNSHPVTLSKLFSLVEEETLDGEDGATVEPVLAETGFTMCHLLEHIELWGPREYYGRTGKYKIRRGPEPKNKPEGQWRQNQSRLRAEMEALQRVPSQAPCSKGFLYNPHDTTRLPGWVSKAETDASRESSPFLNDAADSPSAGSILKDREGRIDDRDNGREGDGA